MSPHRPVYFLPLAYNNNPNNGPFPTETVKKTEIKYQISFKVPVLDKVVTDRARFYFAYTQIAFWQAYHREFSSPFRDTNYEPEAFVELDSNKKVGLFENRLVRLGFAHQSNGRADPLSRSWNRLLR